MANKKDLVNAVSSRTGLTKQASKEAIEAIFGAIASDLERGEGTRVSGFGSFSLVERKARNGRNPQTGEALVIPAKTVVKFKSAKALKAVVK